jgi:hypothetical protein
MNRFGALVAILFLCDLAMPLSPGVFQFEPGQSLEMSRRVSVQTASAQLPLLQHRFPAASIQQAPRPMVHADVRRQAAPPRAFIFRNPQDDSEALTSEDPA